jgi:membrane protein implicated in regulation of membrane protease activity
VSNTWNWILVILGGVMVIAELVMGAATGFDLALMGLAIGIGGGIGLLTGSAKVGLAASAALGLLYLAFFRRWIRSKLTATDLASNIDAVVGRTGVVTVRVASHDAGQVKVGDETWRAVLADTGAAAREPGEQVRVEAVDGVTLKVR